MDTAYDTKLFNIFAFPPNAKELNKVRRQVSLKLLAMFSMELSIIVTLIDTMLGNHMGIVSIVLFFVMSMMVGMVIDMKHNINMLKLNPLILITLGIIATSYFSYSSQMIGHPFAPLGVLVTIIFYNALVLVGFKLYHTFRKTKVETWVSAYNILEDIDLIDYVKITKCCEHDGYANDYRIRVLHQNRKMVMAEKIMFSNHFARY